MNTVPTHAVEFAGFVLMHCALIADANRNGELICPFAIVETEDGRRLLDFESETQQQAVEKGWASLEEWKQTSHAWGFGREGLQRPRDSDIALDVILATVWITGMDVPLSVIQKFGRDNDQALYLIGAPELSVHASQIATVVEDWDRASLVAGVSLHPQGEKWAHWQAQ